MLSCQLTSLAVLAPSLLVKGSAFSINIYTCSKIGVQPKKNRKCMTLAAACQNPVAGNEGTSLIRPLMTGTPKEDKADERSPSGGWGQCAHHHHYT